MERFREFLYKGGTALFSVVTILSTFHILDPARTAALSYGITTLLSLFGVTIAGTAAYNITKQRKDGTFTEVAPADAVVNGVQAIIDARQSAEQQLQRVQDVVGGLVSGVNKEISDIGPLATQVLDSIRK